MVNNKPEYNVPLGPEFQWHVSLCKENERKQVNAISLNSFEL